MAFASSDEVLAAVLSREYADYRHAPDIEARAAFLSPHCRQICRPHPSYGASDRRAILEFLYEASGERPYDKTPTPIQQVLQSQADVPPGAKAYYTIRPLKQGELSFGNVPGDPVRGFMDSETMMDMAVDRKWVGMRVDMWTDGGAGKGGEKLGLLVKVQYWWTKEHDKWAQIAHDIMYLGSRDGSEGVNGEILQ
ncbi:predicted protein [Verticillium alfalfae VaMs.102]|uniref:Predicted protein n=1 Tax=Verticillium alfalfae (strain VaMs.102 / ATCC MYA-4576 / FGSC 10136) TaxID=526221 RepID=C9SDS6_VERA1|nr:predicted protein [Verticillium alfalfae VaMs.102]EEY17196.1 predicted protein [Verticillium alfalfae VaMs.102]